MVLNPFSLFVRAYNFYALVPFLLWIEVMKVKGDRIDESCSSMSCKKVVNGEIASNFKKNPMKQKASCVYAVKTSFDPISDEKESCSQILKKSVSPCCSEPGCVPSHTENESSHSVGGSLKFFKDGKFILELSYKKEGDKACWIPVAKKPYWPPMNISVSRPGSLTSLSVSDDNSSVISFPSQRDHLWKQGNPRKNTINNVGFIYRKDKSTFRNNTKSIYLSRKPFFPNVNDINMGSRKKIHYRIDLNTVVKNLWERLVTNRTLPDMVSPRKRILREFEKISLKESSKRQKGSSHIFSTYSIAAILENSYDSVLRNLLRTPSSSDYLLFNSHGAASSCSKRTVSNSQPPTSFSGSGLNLGHHKIPIWNPVQQSISGSHLSLPECHMCHFCPVTNQQDNPLGENLPDVPLNLSKHSS